MTGESGEWIELKGVRTHNLRGFDLRLPIGKMIAIAGVSGSGKSSLAFDTLFAEGQRRFLESASPFLRSMLDRIPRPRVAEIAGLPPTVAVRQESLRRRDPRSTVATLCEIHDYLRVLYARCGEGACPNCGLRIALATLDDMLDDTMARPEGERIHILAPLVRGKVGEHREELLKIKREGYVRARIDGTLALVDSGMQLDPNMAHTIDMVVDRQVVRPGLRERLGESFAAALKHGDGLMTIATLDDEFEWHDRTFASRLVCVQCGSSLPALEPRLFSYSSPEGACSACDGLGRRHLPDWNQLVRDPSASLEGGALGAPGEGIPGDWVKAWAKKGIAVDRPAAEMSEEHRAALLADLEERMEACEDEELRGWLDDSLVERKCDECGGGRLGPAGRSVRIGGATLPELTAMPARDALTQVAAWTFPESMQAVARPLVAGVRSRLEFLSRTGLGYLELDRESWTLSGGEHQRTRLARCLGSALAGVCYVLDEPTAGLHARDARRLATPIADLCAAGNTLVVVEHDPATIRRSDWMVEIGPRAGTGGGEVTASGPTATVLAGESATAKWLRAKAVGVRKKRPPATDYLTVEGATHRNLKDVSVRIPLARRTTLTGVSGSGKTTLAMEVLAPALRHALGLAGPPPFPPRALKGHEKIKRLVIADQRPIGRSPRSTPATFAGILDGLRWVYAQTKEAKVRGWAPARFAPNAKGGACATCKGLGAQKLETDAFGAEYAPCPTCKGKRFNPATLAIRFKGLDISEALGLTIADAAEFFTNQPKVAPKLKVLAELGLGYLRLDQWATTLSGGEAQRLKLALELAKERPEPTLFLLDEPTTGLHGSDVADLLATLDRLCDAGHTVLAVEHQLDVIRTSDWVIDMGPEGGPEGGKAVIEGTPEEVQACAASLTGAALRGEFDLG